MTRPAPKRVVHVSIDSKRRRWSVREEALARLWEHENRPRPGINYGHGVLQDLMFSPRGHFASLYQGTCRHIIRNRDAAIVATVVQWLGTNVGFGFLERALKMMGKRIIDIEPGDHSPWIGADDRLPARSGRYLVREKLRGGVGRYSYNQEMDFLVGTVPGKTGTWMRHNRERAEVALWYEPEELRG